MAQENVCVKDVGETQWYYTICIIDESEAILVFGCFCLRPEKKKYCEVHRTVDVFHYACV